MATTELTPITMPNEPHRFEGRHIDELLVFGFQSNASDITIQSGERVMLEVSGRLHKCTKRELTTAEVSDLLNHLYGPNGTTQLLRGEDLDTQHEVKPTRNERFRFRINATACAVKGHGAIQITARTIPTTPPLLADLDLPSSIVEAAAPRDGVVYVTGATGSGKSTLLAAMIRNLAEQEDSHRKILTYEAPIEFVYDTLDTPTSIISQSEIPAHLPSFAAGVRNALRRKPHGILVGESRDAETITAVIEAALTGHPVYTTLHSNGVSETIRRLVGSFSHEDRNGKTIDIIETMRLVIWQQLVPSTDGGRTPLREYMVFNEKVRDQILDSDLDNITATTRAALHEYGQPMRVDIEEKYKAGLISDRLHKILIAQLR